MCLIMAVLGLPGCVGASPAVVRGLSRGLSYVEHRLQGMWASVLQHTGSVVEASGLWSTGLGVEAPGLSCSTAHRVFPNQGLHPCLQHQRACACLVTRSCRALCDWRTIAHQALSSMGFFSKNTREACCLLLPGDLLDPGIKAMSPLAGELFTTESPGFHIIWLLL